MTSYNAFRHLCRSLFISDDDFMPLLTFYGDDSGTHQDSRTVVVAGYVGQVAAWEKFSRQWSEVLREFGAKHMRRSDLESFMGEYKREKGWDEERRKKFLKQLYPIIELHTTAPIGEAVIVEDFETMVPDDVKERVGGPYGWCAHWCMAAMNVWCDKKNYNRPIQYVFEAGTVGHGQVDRTFRNIYLNRNDRDRFRLRGWAFQDKSIVPLQAADVLAYEGFKQIENQILDKGKRPERISFTHLAGTAGMYLRYWDKSRFLRWRQDYDDFLLTREHRTTSPS